MNKLCTIVLFLFVQYGLASVCVAENKSEHIEHKIKAAFLYKFASYIEWPPATFAHTEIPLTIGVVGADEIAAELFAISQGNRVDGRMIEVKSLTPADSPNNLHILFIGRNVGEHLQSLLAGAHAQPILTVTETEGALSAGSIINFIPVNEYIRFEISMENADHCNLKISARLLGVAQKIQARKL